MKRLAIFIAAIFFAAPLYGQQIPSIGKVIKNSPEYNTLSNGCTIGYNKLDDKIFCVGFDSIWLSIPATAFGTGTQTPPTIYSDVPAYAEFVKNPTGQESITVDFILPRVLPMEMTLSHTSTEYGVVLWNVMACTYAVGEIPCTPISIANVASQSSPNRNDAILDLRTRPWQEGDHVIIEIARSALDVLDNLQAGARLDTIVLEFTRKYP